MRAGTAVSLAVALVFGLVAAVLARGLIQSSNVPRTSERRIVVAAKPIAFGAELTSENLREISWSSETALEGSFASISDVNRDGRRLALVSLQPGEPVLGSKMTAPNQRATLSTQIDEGMRAVSIRVDEVRGVAGFIFPGDRVDVILTRGETGAQDAAAAFADVLLQNAKVLAIDQSAYERADKPAIARAVTLELNVQDAQSVILAQAIGRLSLVLRQTNESGNRPTARVTTADITNGHVPNPSDSRVAELERQLADVKRAAELANSRLAEGNGQLSDMETRLRAELAKQGGTGAAPAPVAAAAPGTVVNVIRNGVKKEQYSVVSER